MLNPLQPSPAILCKLASIAVHADEYLLTAQSHQYDLDALIPLLTDADVLTWLAAMTEAGMAPVKRSAAPKKSKRK